MISYLLSLHIVSNTTFRIPHKTISVSEFGTQINTPDEAFVVTVSNVFKTT